MNGEHYLKDCTNYKVWWSRDNAAGCSSGVDLGLLVSVKGKRNASTYRNFLDNSVLLTVCEQFGDGPPLTLPQCKTEAHKDTPLGSTRKSVFVFSNVLLNGQKSPHALQSLLKGAL